MVGGALPNLRAVAPVAGFGPDHPGRTWVGTLQKAENRLLKIKSNVTKINMEENRVSYEVVIVGAGPVGLMLGAELGCYGIRTAVFDAGSPRSPAHPRANNQSARSMEFYRRLGIADQLRATGMPAGYATDATYMTTFNGHEITRVALPSKAEALARCRAGDPFWQSAEPQLRTSQRSLTPLLARRLSDLNSVEVFENTVVDQVTASAGGVTLRLANGSFVTGRYCVGCDGARSLVRRAMGIRFEGEGGLSMDFMGGRMIASYFRSANLKTLTGLRDAWQHWAILPDLRAVMVTLDGAEEFILHRQLPDGIEPSEYDLLRDLDRLCGPGIEAEVLSSASWRAGQALVAPSFRRGPLFLAGDSAHLFTPTGGMGLNTGIEDAVNLAWKLAEVCRGRGGERLLDSYSEERQPVAHRNTRYALQLARAVGDCPVAAEIADDTPEGQAARNTARLHIDTFARNEFEHPGIGLGVRYDGSALIAPDGAPPPDDAVRYVPSTVPGGRLPHVWLGENRSLLDLAGHGFTLIDLDGCLPELPDDWCAGQAVAVARLDRPDLARAFGAQALLVRPDQMIAWRASGPGPVTVRDLSGALNMARGIEQSENRRARA